MMFAKKTYVISSKASTLELMNSETAWYGRAVKAIATKMSNKRFVVKQEMCQKYSGKFYWKIVVRGRPSDGDATKLVNALLATGWMDYEINICEFNTEIILFKD